MNKVEKSKKITLKYNGNVYSLPVNALNIRAGKKPEIVLTAKHTASIIKQYIKSLSKKYKINISYWCTSETYSGGSSVNIHVSNPDGSPIRVIIFDQIRKFANGLKAGSFDGMTDSYDYGENGVTDNGTTISFYAKFIFVENSPKWDTLEHCLKSVAKGESVEDVVKYVSESTKNKVLKHFGE